MAQAADGTSEFTLSRRSACILTASKALQGLHVLLNNEQHNRPQRSGTYILPLFVHVTAHAVCDWQESSANAKLTCKGAAWAISACAGTWRRAAHSWPGPAIMRTRSSVMSFIAHRTPSRPSPLSLTPPYGCATHDPSLRMSGISRPVSRTYEGCRVYSAVLLSTATSSCSHGPASGASKKPQPSRRSTCCRVQQNACKHAATQTAGSAGLWTPSTALFGEMHRAALSGPTTPSCTVFLICHATATTGWICEEAFPEHGTLTRCWRGRRLSGD